MTVGDSYPHHLLAVVITSCKVSSYDHVRDFMYKRQLERSSRPCADWNTPAGRSIASEGREWELDAVCRLPPGPPMLLVGLLPTEKIELADPPLNGVFHYRNHELGPGAEISKFWIETLQVTENGVSLEQ